MKPPWWFCMGWWSPWCVADAALHWFHRTFHEDRCGWVCEKHDRALIRHWERHPEPPAVGPTITVNPSWTSASNATYTWTPKP